MGKIRAAELGFDACMFMLHKTFGAPKAGGGPAVGAYGCSELLAPFLPGPLVSRDGDRYRLTEAGPPSVGRVREFLGNVPELVKAYAWVRAMGGDGHRPRLGPVGAGQQLHGEEAPRDPRRLEVAPAASPSGGSR